MPVTDVNREFFDAMVRHQVFLMRLSGGIRNKVQLLLNKSEKQIAKTIRDRLANSTGLDTPAEVRRLETVLAIVRNTRTKSWEQVNKTWAEELAAIAKTEPALVSGMILTTAPVVVQTVLPSARLLKAIATSKPFEGRTMKAWAETMEQDDLRRMEAAIRTGMVAGEGSAQIARRVVGTARLLGSDGVTEITRRQAAAITRTAVNHVANEARKEFFKENADILKEEQYVATLDSRTTPICRSLDGKRFPVGEGPRPPLHFNCRSIRVPVIDGVALGNRPAKPVTEKQLLREFAAKKGFEETPGTRKVLPRGTKGEFDEFARKRVRELTGTVPAKTTYQEWLTRQSAAFQDDVLGKTKGSLFRRGGLTLDKFVDRAGNELPLNELARRHADAFRAAGLDPTGF